MRHWVKIYAAPPSWKYKLPLTLLKWNVHVENIRVSTVVVFSEAYAAQQEHTVYLIGRFVETGAIVSLIMVGLTTHCGTLPRCGGNATW